MSQTTYLDSSARQSSSESSSRSSSRNVQEVDQSYSDSDVESPVNPNTKKRKRATTKKRGACMHCKSLKVRCEFTQGETRCQRCVAGNYQCLARTRKQRKPAPTHEDLQARSKQQDEQIQSLLRQFDQLKMNRKIDGWVRRAHATYSPQRDGEIARPVPVVTCHYYAALIGALNIDVSAHNPDYFRLPMIVRTRIIDLHEILDLFNLFFERINPFFSLLDGELHCPQKLIWTNEFLFTTICALASRHYTQRSGLYDLMMDIAVDIAGDALLQGPKDVETVQAFLLLAVYPVPKKSWLDDRSWLYMGAAIRLAQELELDKPPMGLTDQDNANRSGKMSMVNADDHLVRTTARIWYKEPSSSPYDIGLCAYAEMLLLMAQFRKALRHGIASQEKLELDIIEIATTYDGRLNDLYVYWNQQLEEDPNVQVCPVVRYRFHNFSLIASYLRLVVLSQGFQHYVKTGISRDSYILRQSMEVAQIAIRTVLEKLYPSSLLGWAMEANFLYMSFCAAFLLNLLRPKFLPLLEPRQCATIVTLVQRLIAILASEDVALDGKHFPAVYSKFLLNLFNKYYTPSLQQDIKSASAEILPQYQEERVQTPPHAYSWPDVPSVSGTPGTIGMFDTQSHDSSSSRGHVVRQEVGEAEMDFSLQHFIRSTVSPPAAMNGAYMDAEALPVPIVHYPQPAAQDWDYQPPAGSGYYGTVYH